MSVPLYDPKLQTLSSHAPTPASSTLQFSPFETHKRTSSSHPIPRIFAWTIAASPTTNDQAFQAPCHTKFIKGF